MSYRKWALVSLLLISNAASAGMGCWDEPALSTRRLGSFAVMQTPLQLGIWNLPINSRHPSTLSSAIARVEVAPYPDGMTWIFQVHFSFDVTEGTVGIPYSFQKAILHWRESNVERTLTLDWSNDCTAVGGTLFPGQSWSAIGKAERTAVTDGLIQDLRVEIFGDRN